MKVNVSLLILVIILVAFIGGCTKNKGDIIYDRNYIQEIKEARDNAMLFMATNDVPGASFTISIDGKMVYSEGMGKASKDLNVPASRETKYRIGEISELFTSLIYQLMIEDGTLNPKSTVGEFIPDFPGTGSYITLEQLASHTSGIRKPNGSEEDWRGLNVTIEMGIDNFKNDSLSEGPGWFETNSMFNYNLLGAIMEKASGKSYSELLKNYVTDTLKLHNTVVDHPFRTVENRTDFFNYNYIAQVIPATFRDMRYRAPSAGLLSTTEDLVKFGNAVLFSDYLSDELKERWFEPYRMNDGTPTQMSNGWMVLLSKRNTELYGRSGKVTGGAATLVIYPEEKIVTAIATNLDVRPGDIPVFQMTNHFLPEIGNENGESTENQEKEIE